MITEEKELYINPAELLPTVGDELLFFISSNGYNFENITKILGLEELKNLKWITKDQFKKLECEISNTDILNYLAEFQIDYKNDTKRSLASYQSSKLFYKKFKNILPIIPIDYKTNIDIVGDIVDYYGIDDENEETLIFHQQNILFKKSDKIGIDDINLSAFLRYGDIKSQNQKLTELNIPGLIKWIDSKEWYHGLHDSSYLNFFEKVLPEFGISLVLTPSLPKTPFGLVRWKDGHPFIQVSDRNKDLPTCWITLFHEIGHVCLHKNISIIDDQIDCKTKKKEIEANHFASSYLFNGDSLRKEIFANKLNPNRLSKEEYSKKYNSHLIFIDYWYKKASIDPPYKNMHPVEFIP